MRNALLALGLFSLATIHPALAETPDTVGSWQDAPVAGPVGSLRPGAGVPWGMQPPPFHRPGGPKTPEMALAARLAALETRIGITAGQLDAWRAYTSALQALLAPPKMAGGASPDKTGPGHPAEGAPSRPGNEPFALEEMLAERAVARASAAAELKQAIATLRSTLSPGQLELLASAGGAGPRDGAAGPSSGWPDMPRPQGESPHRRQP